MTEKITDAEIRRMSDAELFAAAEKVAAATRLDWDLMDRLDAEMTRRMALFL